MSSSDPSRHPIVLRFAELFPAQLSRYLQHEARKGRGSAHCDAARAPLNMRLIGSDLWAELLLAEVEEARASNHAEELEALLARKRRKDALAKSLAGPSDPWRASKGGPLREVILTAHRDWFDGRPVGGVEGDPAPAAGEVIVRERLFEETALGWLEESFGEMVVTARADHDEITYHIHAVIAPWVEKVSKGRGRQRLLQPSAHPLLADYTAAQDSVGAAFERLGLRRGKRRAERARDARARGEVAPEPVVHVPAHVWRQQEAARLAGLGDALRSEADGLADDRVALVADQLQLASDSYEVEIRREALDERATVQVARERATADREEAVALREAAVGGREAEATIAVVEAFLDDGIAPDELDGARGDAALGRRPDVAAALAAAPSRAMRLRRALGGWARRMRDEAGLRARSGLIERERAAQDREAALEARAVDLHRQSEAVERRDAEARGAVRAALRLRTAVHARIGRLLTMIGGPMRDRLAAELAPLEAEIEAAADALERDRTQEKRGDDRS